MPSDATGFDRSIKIAPSILSADFARLGQEVRAVEEAGADWIHVHVKTVMDCHLMIAPADPYLEAFAEAGADIITVHAEAGQHLDRSLQATRALGCKAGVSLNPSTPESVLDYVMDKIDLVLVMTVNPGFGGQGFIESQVEKIRRIRAMIGDRPIHLQVDGGVSPATAGACAAAGADSLVAGSAVFKGGTPDDPAAYAANISAIRKAAEAAL